jgi:pSer/pThr/pTyr-binding forkhead associated (FHA) protein
MGDDWDDPSTDVQEYATTTGKPSVREPALGQAILVMLTGATIGRRFALGRFATVGRSADNTIVVDDPKVSHVHAKLKLTTEG